MSFDAFADWLNTEEGQDACADRHWMSQYRFLYRDNGDCICDFVGRYENLDKDVNKVCKILKIKRISLPQSGWISQDPPPISDEVRALIRQRYAKDYELFGYND